MHSPSRSALRPRRTRRGSLLIVAMILAVVIGISLVSYLRLSSTSLRLASRSFLNSSAINVAETGLEHALYSLNRNQANGVALATAWDGWTTNTTAHTARHTFPISGNFTIAPGTSGSVKVYVENYDLIGPPVILAKSIIRSADGSVPLNKFIQVQLQRRSMWAYGLVGKTSVRMNSNAKADSWISDADNNPATAGVAFAAGLRRDRGSVGVVATGNGAMAMDSNAEIFGTANTGGGTVATNSNVRIYSATSPGTPKVDTSQIHRDFTFTFPAITEPAPAAVNNITATWVNNTTLPRGGDVADGGVYYYNFAAGHNINLDSNKTLTINQPAVFLFKNHSGVLSFRTSSNANVNVASTATVKIYTNGNISMDSNNNINVGNDASKFFIYGTNPSAQTFTLDSNVQIYACIYAPFAALTMNSNTDVHGAVVAGSIQMDSNAEFHYDESLANLGGSGGYRVARWKELQSAAERAPYLTLLNF